MRHLLKTEVGHLSVITKKGTERLALQDAGRELKDARALVGARRRAFPRHAPSSHAAALEALERMRQNQAAAGPSLPQVSPSILMHMHSDVLSLLLSFCRCRLLLGSIKRPSFASAYIEADNAEIGCWPCRLRRALESPRARWRPRCASAWPWGTLRSSSAWPTWRPCATRTSTGSCRRCSGTSCSTSSWRPARPGTG